MGGDISLGYSIVASVLVKMAIVGNLWEKIFTNCFKNEILAINEIAAGGHTYIA